jgi:hypothetical protein
MVGGKLVVRRAVNEKMLVLAASLTVLFALVMLATLTAYTATVTREGLARTLGEASFDQIGTRVSKQVSPGKYAEDEGLLRARLKSAFGGVPLDVDASARGESFAVPGQAKLAHPELTTFAMYGGLAENASLEEGAWPADGGSGPVQAVVSAPAAALLKVRVGDVIAVTNRLDHSPVEVKIVGRYKVTSPDAPVWQRDKLAVRGVERLDYTTVGPLVVDPAVFVRQFMPRGAAVSWVVLPDTARMTASDVHGLADRLSTMSVALKSVDYGLVSGLPEEAAQVDTALLVTRSTMLVPVLQLVVLAG